MVTSQSNLQVVGSKVDPTQPEWYKQPRRPIAQIIADLSKPIPKKYLDTRKQGGASITYLPWYNAVKLLDRVTGGHWDYQITDIHTTSDRLILTARITIYAEEGSFAREATGTETLKEEYFDKTTQSKQIREWAYGDVASKTESMALRRAAYSIQKINNKQQQQRVYVFLKCKD